MREMFKNCAEYVNEASFPHMKQRAVGASTANKEKVEGRWSKNSPHGQCGAMWSARKTQFTLNLKSKV